MGAKRDSGFEYFMDKAKSYCAYQERCLSDIRKRLFDWRVNSQDAKKIIGQLIAEDFIDEGRFARIFTGSKFRIKKWGRKKIVAALRSKGIPDNIIEESLGEINEKDYHETLQLLISKKKSELKDTNPQVIRSKVVNFARSRGFEPDLIFKYI